MKLIEALNLINKLEVPAFYTDDIAAYLHLSMTGASQTLRRLSKSGHVIRLKAGLWAIPDKIDPLALPNYLLAPLPSYISFHSALYYRNVIDQIPSIIYAATLRKTIKFTTPIATVSAHQIQPDFFFGYTFDEKTGVKMATAEKALIDTLYLSPAKSGIFKALPELDKEELNLNEAQRIIEKIPSKRRRTLVQKRFNGLFGF